MHLFYPNSNPCDTYSAANRTACVNGMKCMRGQRRSIRPPICINQIGDKNDICTPQVASHVNGLEGTFKHGLNSDPVKQPSPKQFRGQLDQPVKRFSRNNGDEQSSNESHTSSIGVAGQVLASHIGSNPDAEGVNDGRLDEEIAWDIVSDMLCSFGGSDAYSKIVCQAARGTCYGRLIARHWRSLKSRRIPLR
jgi:hypothetical protein